MKNNNLFLPELLAPAGKPAALRAAVLNGADAVYIGEKSFSARKNAENFTKDEIRAAAEFCHIRGVKLHLALNTLVHDGELKAFEKTVCECVQCGIDAFIVQDLGAARLIREICPQIALHASTQLTAANACDVIKLQEAGFSRIVLSRELSYDEIYAIRRQTDAELEVFVHGALCISFSGKCLMSSFIGGRSGNRGECAQPCRKKYFSGGKEGYFLSPKDLCLADEIERIKQCGIDSLKIEGRMKSAEYVASAVRTYRKYLDNPAPLKEEDKASLTKIFMRGSDFTKGYFLKLNTPEIMNYDITNDNLAARADKEALHLARETYRDGIDINKIPIDAYLKIERDKKAHLVFKDCDNNISEVFGDIAQAALTRGITAESAKNAVSKLGQTPYFLKNIRCEIEDGLFLSASQLNLLRRECVKKLDSLRGAIPAIKTFVPSFLSSPVKKEISKPKICAQITTPNQFYAVKDADFVAVPLSLWKSITPDERCILYLPPVILNPDLIREELSKISGVKAAYTASLGGAGLLNEFSAEPIGDWGLNIFNAECANVLSRDFKRLTLSPELTLSEISYITARTPAQCEIIVYGRQALMLSRACLIRGIKNKCGCTHPVSLRDGTGAQFFVFGDSLTHLNTLVNSRPTFTADKLRELKKSGAEVYRLCFTTETPEEAQSITKMYKGLSPVKKPPVYTRGYFFK